MAKEKKTFILVDAKHKPKGAQFKNAQPRGAAMKAANRGHKTIRLKEVGTNRVHVFKGKVTRVKAPPSAPEWSVKNGKVKKASVEKTGVETYKK